MDENDSNHIEAWLRLRHSKLTLTDASTLVHRLGGAEAVMRCHPGDLPVAEAGRVFEALKAANKRAILNDLRWYDATEHHHIISCLDSRYPVLLRELADAPLLLYVEGEPELFNCCQLAVVGSRNPTPAGTDLAFRFAFNLTRLGLTITSGLALGIDAAAHRGALSAAGPTIAVMASGLDRVYPPEHHKLARQIAENGMLISEMPVGAPPRKQAFPQRNRIISGLSVGTLVVEAARSSGSLITARLAGEQGREVYAVPGSILSAQSKGCHALLRDGARLVETEADVLSELTHIRSADSNGPSAELTPDCQSLIGFMGFDPVTIDTLVARSGLTADKVCSMLSRMELKGVVKLVFGGRYLRVV